MLSFHPVSGDLTSFLSCTEWLLLYAYRYTPATYYWYTVLHIVCANCNSIVVCSYCTYRNWDFRATSNYISQTESKILILCLWDPFCFNLKESLSTSFCSCVMITSTDSALENQADRVNVFAHHWIYLTRISTGFIHQSLVTGVGELWPV